MIYQKIWPILFLLQAKIRLLHLAETPFGIYVFVINDISPAEIHLFSDIKSSLADEIRNERLSIQVYDRIQLFETAQESGQLWKKQQQKP